MRITLTVFVSLLILSCQGTLPVQSDGLPGEVREFTTSIQDQKRKARIYVPAGYEKKLPVIVLLHGSGSDGASVEIQSGLSGAAQKKGFIAVYPDALPLDPTRPAGATNPRVWSDGSGRGFAGEHPQNDIEFLKKLINSMKKESNVDSNQIHLVGFSNGGSMSFRLAREIPEYFGRIAIVAGVSWIESTSRPSRDLLYITGRQDPVIPPNRKIEQLPNGNVDRSTSVSSTLLQWIDRCPSTDYGPGLPPDLRHRSVMFNCTDYRVQYLELPRTGHVWPGGADDPTAELDATSYIVRFLLDRKAQAHLLDR